MTRCMKEIVECATAYVQCILTETTRKKIKNLCLQLLFQLHIFNHDGLFLAQTLIYIKLDISSCLVSSDKIRNWNRLHASAIEQHTSATGRLALLMACKK